MLRRLLLCLVLALIGAGFHAGHARAADSPCFGPPADYVAAYDGVRGQAVDGAVTYAYPTVYLAFQSWLTKNDGVAVPGHHSEHIHYEGCFPQGEIWNDANAPAADRWQDIKIVFHNIVGYKVTQFDMALRHSNGSGAGFKTNATTNPELLAELNTAAQASADTTVSVFQSRKVAAPQTNGIKEASTVLTVRRDGPEALVEEWFLDARWFYEQQYTGLASSVPVSSDVGFMRTRTWICLNPGTPPTGCGYGYTGFGDSLLNRPTLPEWKASAMGVLRPDVWNVSWRSSDGPNQGSFFVDPNFHVHPDTYVWRADIPRPIPTVGDPNQFEYRMDVPLGALALSGGVHRLMIHGHTWPNTIGPSPIRTNVLVIPFRVAPSDTQAPSEPVAYGKSNLTATSLRINWSASTDNVGVAGYRTYRDGVFQGTTQALNFTFTGLSGPTHQLQIEAFDAAGNVSTRETVNITKGTWPLWTS